MKQVDDNTVSIRHRISTLAYDIRPKIDPDQRGQLKSLRIGDRVTYEGKIVSAAGNLAAHVLEDGKIVSSQTMKGTEAQAYLLEQEAATIEWHQ